jgi:O-antigen/teichoic acid export membrane protein
MAAELAEALAPGAFLSRVRRSAMLFGALATAVRVGANLLLLPLMLRILPSSDLGLWYVFLALGGIANLADFGFAQAITRVYSFFWAGADDFQTEGFGEPPRDHEPNKPRIREFHDAVKALYRTIAWIATLLMALVGTLCVLKPIGGTTDPTMGWLCWAGFIAATAYSVGTSSWSAACQGIDRVRDLQKAQLFGGLVYVVIAAGLLVGGLGLFAVVAATAMRAFLTFRICRNAYLEEVPAVPGVAAMQVGIMLKRLWPNARKFGIISVGAYLTIQANMLICSHILGNDMTASYGLTSQVGNILMAFSALWLGVKWPQITILRTQGRSNEMARLFARRLAMVMLTLAGMSIGLGLLGNTVLELMGSRTKLLVGPLLAVYLFHLFQQQFYVQFGSLAYTENTVPFVYLSLSTGLATVVLGTAMTYYFGVWGLVLAPLIVTGTSSAWYVTWRGFRGQPLTVPQFARAAVSGRV